MERKTNSTGEFREAIRNFSKLSLEVDSLTNAGNSDAHRLMNKSIEHRNEAIANEAINRLKLFEVEPKGTKSKEALKSHDKMKQLFFEEAKMEFDKAVAAEKVRLRSGSAIDVNETVTKSENVEDSNSKKVSSDEESENESDEEESDDTETTEKDSSEEDEDESSADTDDDENTDDEAETKVADSNNK